MRLFSTLSLVIAFGLAACGGAAEENGTEADTTAMDVETETEPAGMTTPAWMSVDETAQTVTLQISAGSTDANNRWNFNGLYAGAGSITVPAGYTVTIDFTNADPTQPHSLGIDEVMASWPATFETVEPVFAGAVSPDATTTGTAPNGTASITFTATDAGEYAMVCYIPGHAIAGMVVPFNVSADGSYGATQ
jgi:sulfocyanin